MIASTAFALQEPAYEATRQAFLEDRPYSALYRHNIMASGHDGGSFGVSAHLIGHHADKFPAYVKARNTKCSTMTDGEIAETVFHVSLSPVKGNARNDAGFKRLQRFLATCDKLGLFVEQRYLIKNQVHVADILNAY